MEREKEREDACLDRHMINPCVLSVFYSCSTHSPSRPLPHPLYDITESEICLIVKDHDGQGHKDAKKKIKEIEPECGINKVERKRVDGMKRSIIIRSLFLLR